MDSIKYLTRAMAQGWNNITVDNEHNLDISEITPRIYAMSFPANDCIEKFYRHSIKTVGNFIEERKYKFHIFNVSGREYVKSDFKDQVTDYLQWKDEHNPPLSLLFQACMDIHEFLRQDPENKVIIHCNNGGGRTGTLISCYLQFCGFFDSAQNAITYFGWKRFKNGIGITQPSLLRYIFYFQEALQKKSFDPVTILLDSIIIPAILMQRFSKIQIKIQQLCEDSQEMDGVLQQNSNNSIDFNFQDCKIQGNLLIKIIVFEQNSNPKEQNSNPKLLCRMGIHTSFLSLQQVNKDLYMHEINLKQLDQGDLDLDYFNQNHQDDFKIKLQIRNGYEFEDQKFVGHQQQEYEIIQDIKEIRKQKLGEQNQQEFGKQMMFGNHQSDHEQILQNGHDKNIQGLFENQENKLKQYNVYLISTVQSTFQETNGQDSFVDLAKRFDYNHNSRKATKHNEGDVYFADDEPINIMNQTKSKSQIVNSNNQI